MKVEYSEKLLRAMKGVEIKYTSNNSVKYVKHCNDKVVCVYITKEDFVLSHIKNIKTVDYITVCAGNSEYECDMFDELCEDSHMWNVSTGDLWTFKAISSILEFHLKVNEDIAREDNQNMISFYPTDIRRAKVYFSLIEHYCKRNNKKALFYTDFDENNLSSTVEEHNMLSIVNADFDDYGYVGGEKDSITEFVPKIRRR